MNVPMNPVFRKIFNRMLGPLGAIAAIGGFVGDVLQPLLDIAPFAAGISLIIFIGALIALFFYRQTSTVELAESLIPAVLIISAGSTIIFTGYSVMWDEAPERGYIATNVEPVGRAQASLLGLEQEIAEIGETVARTEELVEESAQTAEENQERIANRELPAVGMKNAQLSSDALAAAKRWAKAWNWKEQLQNTYFVSNDWQIIRNRLTGVVTGRKISGVVTMKHPDGRCRFQYVGYRQDHDGTEYMNLHMTGVGPIYDLKCDKL